MNMLTLQKVGFRDFLRHLKVIVRVLGPKSFENVELTCTVHQ